MTFFKCGLTKSWKLLYLIAFPVFWLLSFLCESALMNNEMKTLNACLLLLILYSGKTLSGILEIVSIRIQSKAKKIRDRQLFINSKKGSMKFSYIPSQEIERQSFKIRYVALITFVSLLEIGQFYWSKTITSLSLYDYLQKTYQLKGFQLIPTAFLYRCLIRRQRFFFHHKISLITIGMCLAFIATNSLCFAKDQEQLIYSTLQYFGIYIIVSIQNNLEKWMLDALPLSAYLILFVQGITGIVITSSIILFIEMTGFPDYLNTEGFIEGSSRIFSSPQLVFYLIANVLMSNGFSIFMLLVIKDYSPVHKTLCETLYTFLFVFYSLIANSENRDTVSWICYFICFAIIFAFALIYNEILIIDLQKCRENTSYGITERGIHEEMSLLAFD